MVNGVVVGLRTLLWAFVLLFVLAYILGVTLRATTREMVQVSRSSHGELGTHADCAGTTQYFHDNHELLFGSIMRSMFTVFRCFTDGCSSLDGTPLLVHFWAAGGWIVILGYTLTLLFVTFGVFNIIAAVFVENALEYAERKHLRYDENLHLAQRLQTFALKLCSATMTEEGLQARRLLQGSGQGLRRKFQKTDAVGPADEAKLLQVRISREAFEKCMLDPTVMQLMDDLGVSMKSRYHLFDVFDINSNGFLDVHEIVGGITKLRGHVDKMDVVSAALTMEGIRQDLKAIKENMNSLRNIAPPKVLHLEAELDRLRQQVWGEQETFLMSSHYGPTLSTISL